MRWEKISALAAALLVPTLAFATHIPTSTEPIEYDGTLSPGTAATGEIGWSSPTDGYDWYCFNVTSGTEVTLRATRTSGDIVPNLGIMNGLAETGGTANLPEVAATANSTEDTITLTYTADFDGPVTIWVSTFLNENGGNYTVTMTGGTAGSCTGEVAGPAGPAVVIQIPEELFIDPLLIGPSASSAVKVSTLIDTAQFDSDLFLTVESNALDRHDFHVALDHSEILAPGIGDAEVTVTTGPLTFPRTYIVVVAAVTPEGATVARNSFLVHVSCDPPFILGVNQPPSLSAEDGTQVTLEVTPGGTGPFYYQWYRGFRGMTRDPVLAATDSTLIFTTRETAYYWVRISNACGTADSQAALVTTTGSLNGPARRRSGG